MPVSDARRTFRDARVAHVATVSGDGSPHVVPLWFVWLEEAVFISCRAGSVVWRNLVQDPRVALEFERGRAWTEQEGVMLRGTAEPLPAEHASSKRALSAWFEKYRGDLGGTGFAAYTEEIDEPALFRVVPASISAWSHASPGF
ncbi:MAG TPA: pyridoxamine 5'-phosphate oxidase family protein [Actinomycetota bacterium]|jgi:PPOX class probable F420-dependent enzyme